MDKDTFIKYAPWIVVVFAFFVTYNIFVTPQQLERTHREILNEVNDKYVTRNENAQMQAQLNTMAMQISKIYDKMFAK